MNDGQYLYILLEGYANHRDFLIEYFTREAKEANEKKFINYDEFFSRCYKGIQTLENEWEYQKQEQQSIVIRAINQAYIDQKPEEAEKLKALFEKENTPYHPKHIRIFLDHFTQNKFHGQLFKKDIDTLKIGLLGAIEGIEKELKLKNETPKFDPAQTEKFKEVKAIFDEYKLFEVEKLKGLNDGQKSKVLNELATSAKKQFIAQFILYTKLHKPVMQKEGYKNKREAFRKLEPLGCSESLMSKTTYEHDLAEKFINELKKESL